MNTKFLSKPSQIYCLSLVAGLLFYYPFSLLYVEIFKPIITGSSLFFPAPFFLEKSLAGLYLSFPFFLASLATISKVENKKKLWLWGIVFPFSVALLNGWKDILSYLVISVVGFFLGWLILFFTDKKDSKNI